MAKFFADLLREAAKLQFNDSLPPPDQVEPMLLLTLDGTIPVAAKSIRALAHTNIFIFKFRVFRLTRQEQKSRLTTAFSQLHMVSSRFS
ncbi:MAG: hypothetical protein B7Y04_15650 [Gallionellales bacterium 24-53-125]|nr:MAG: hypothetical protein B7Y04_15650 [Gallionellales bacterium 24-53-125]